MAPTQTGFDYNVKEFPHTYNVPPPQPKVVKNGQMTKTQLDHFFKEGYVILENFIDTALLDDVKKDLEKQALFLFLLSVIIDRFHITINLHCVLG